MAAAAFWRGPGESSRAPAFLFSAGFTFFQSGCVIASADNSTCGALPVRVVVEFSAPASVRAAVFEILEDLPHRQRAKLANQIADRLRRAGLLACGIEQHLRAVDVARLLSRTPEFVVKEAKAGRLGPVARDDGGWLIPASGVQSWLAARMITTD